MKKTSAIYSSYVIDGVPQDAVPAEMLGGAVPGGETFDAIVDESLDPLPGGYSLEIGQYNRYLDILKKAKGNISMPYAGFNARLRVADALISSIWKKGSFVLSDLSACVRLRWKDGAIGSMAAFYDSVRNITEALDGLDVPLSGYEFKEGEPLVELGTSVDESPLAVKPQIVPDSRSWVVYIPFETSEYRLGGSLLASALGLEGGTAPRLDDPDYFIDSFELVRELVEDGILMSASTVSDGGLSAALQRMLPKGTGITLGLSGLRQAFPESGLVQILFAEVPGAIVQINDDDFDYIDAEMILQDIMYFPLGHPSTDFSGIRLDLSEKTGIQGILESLIR